MREYHNRDVKTNDEELDPCIAAEIRMKKAMFSTKTKKVLIGLILLLLFIALLTIGLVLLLVVYPKVRDENNAQISKAAISLEDEPPPKPLEIKEYKPVKTSYIELKPSNKNLEDATIEEPSEPEEIQMNPPVVLKNQPSVVVSQHTVDVRPTPPVIPETTTKRPTQRPTQRPTTIRVIGSDNVLDVRPSLVTPLDQIYEFIEVDEVKETCDDYRLAGYKKSGVYKMRVPGFTEFRSLCLLENDYGWNVLQRRTGPELQFWNKTFNEYADGFGVPTGDHWLGLEKVSAYVKRGHKLQLRIVLQHDLCNEKGKCSGIGDSGYWFADWDFKIGDRASKYKLTVSSMVHGNLSDTQKDPLQWLNNEQPFTTVDSDNDRHRSYNCAHHRQYGGWWHKDCSYVALNGEYGTTQSKPRGMHWTYQAVGSSHGVRSGAIVSYVIKPKYSLMLFRVNATIKDRS
uniref:Fibrinogen C-terminal domain-containing protein n=1 Tax=Acrobeloides nanus TaxID=290746 RepID=A0A914BZ87_9BILA